MKFAEVFGVSPRGGTTFSAPLFRSLDILEDAQKAAHKPLKRADLIFLTDGEADVPSDAIVRLQALKAKIGLHVTAILVGSDTNPNYVASFADKIESIKDLTSGSAAVVFKEVVKT
jgi:uncharacterized protein with von Willebrand factor type A (vWA) domain